MLRRLFRLPVGQRYHRLVLLLGLAAAAWALKGLSQTAIYVHESQCVPGVVVDVRRYPADIDWRDLLSGKGGASVFYRPIVHFELPGNGARMERLMPDATAVDYTDEQQVEVRTMPLDPSTARLNSPRELWAADAALLGIGAALVLLSRLLRGRRKLMRQASRPQEPPRQKADTPAKTAPKSRRETKKKNVANAGHGATSSVVLPRSAQKESAPGISPTEEKPKRRRKSNNPPSKPGKPGKRKESG